MSVKQPFEALLVCPVCHSSLVQSDTSLSCSNIACEQQYPIIGKIPILVADQLGTFNVSTYRDSRNALPRQSVRKRLRRFIPRITANLVGYRNIRAFTGRLLREANPPLVLVLGGAEVGDGMQGLLMNRRVQCLESDIVIGPRTEIVFDANHIPVQSGSVDGVVVQAVLEYILDPSAVVSEIYRVLKPNGIVYSEMPFLQQVHGGRYDFTRLTHLGHIRLYRHFEEIESGACAGPATALAWALQQFFLSFARSSWQRDVVKILTGSFFFWIRFFDYLLARTPGWLDGATGTFLLAQKSERILPDRELITKYRGSVPMGDVL